VHLQERITWFDAALILAAAIFSFGLLAFLTLAPRNEAPGVAVIFSPWTNARDALSRSAEAGSRFVRFGAFDFIAVVEPDNEHFARQVRARGAWFIADPAALAACLKPFARSRV